MVSILAGGERRTQGKRVRASGILQFLIPSGFKRAYPPRVKSGIAVNDPPT